MSFFAFSLIIFHVFYLINVYLCTLSLSHKQSNRLQAGCYPSLIKSTVNSFRFCSNGRK
uniref:Uncharacterized protein n=1 Tax=Fundulus heteroclitus TaxID=8078 RepID=A0A3Q2PTA4_FUNHE